MWALIENGLEHNGLITAFAFVGVIMWVSVILSKRLTFGRIHGSAIAIVIGLVLAWVGGTLMGDYTTTVAERIPREVFEYMRKNGGSLRLKIRVVDGAVLVGWDVEKYVPVEGWKPGDGDSGFHYYMAGGDFREDRVYNGKIVEPGWEHIPPAGTTAPGK